MSIETEAVGGVGIKVTREMFDKMIKAGVFDQREFDESIEKCLEKAAKKIGCKFGVAGNYLNNNHNKGMNYYLFIDGEFLFDCVNKSFEFLGGLDDVGISIRGADLRVISDVVIY